MFGTANNLEREPSRLPLDLQSLIVSLGTQTIEGPSVGLQLLNAAHLFLHSLLSLHPLHLWEGTPLGPPRTSYSLDSKLFPAIYGE